MNFYFWGESCPARSMTNGYNRNIKAGAGSESAIRKPDIPTRGGESMTRKVIWDSAPVPRFHSQRQPVFLSDQTMKERRDKILTRMAEHQLDCLAVYCDLEHGSNFEYLTGFLTRFEAVSYTHLDVYKRQSTISCKPGKLVRSGGML